MRPLSRTRLVAMDDIDWPDYFRDEAAKYRRLAEQTDDPVIKDEMLELASVCEEVANNLEDRLTGGETVAHGATAQRIDLNEACRHFAGIERIDFCSWRAEAWVQKVSNWSGQ